MLCFKVKELRSEHAHRSEAITLPRPAAGRSGLRTGCPKINRRLNTGPKEPSRAGKLIEGLVYVDKERLATLREMGASMCADPQASGVDLEEVRSTIGSFARNYNRRTSAR